MLWLLAWSAAGGLGYLLGSLPTAYLVAQRVSGAFADIRLAGDGNAGAANAGRILGSRWGVLVGTVDIVKGAVPVLFFNTLAGSWDTVSGLGLLSGAAAIAGHVWPVWLRFRGGRGAATAVGVTAAVLTGPVLLAALPAAAILWRTAQHTVDAGLRLRCVADPWQDIVRRLLGRHLLLRGNLHRRGPCISGASSFAAGRWSRSRVVREGRGASPLRALVMRASFEATGLRGI